MPLEECKRARARIHTHTHTHTQHSTRHTQTAKTPGGGGGGGGGGGPPIPPGGGGGGGGGGGPPPPPGGGGGGGGGGGPPTFGPPPGGAGGGGGPPGGGGGGGGPPARGAPPATALAACGASALCTFLSKPPIFTKASSVCCVHTRERQRGEGLRGNRSCAWGEKERFCVLARLLQMSVGMRHLKRRREGRREGVRKEREQM